MKSTVAALLASTLLLTAEASPLRALDPHDLGVALAKGLNLYPDGEIRAHERARPFPELELELQGLAHDPLQDPDGERLYTSPDSWSYAPHVPDSRVVVIEADSVEAADRLVAEGVAKRYQREGVGLVLEQRGRYVLVVEADGHWLLNPHRGKDMLRRAWSVLGAALPEVASRPARARGAYFNDGEILELANEHPALLDRAPEGHLRRDRESGVVGLYPYPDTREHTRFADAFHLTRRDVGAPRRPRVRVAPAGAEGKAGLTGRLGF